jgi:integrase
MSPTRVSPHGSYRIDRRVRGVGRIAVASGAKTVAEFRKREAVLVELVDTGRLDLLRALKAGTISMPELYAAQRTQRLPFVTADVRLEADLWITLKRWLPESAKAQATRRRYAVSVRALQVKGGLPAQVAVRALQTVDWPALARRWGTSAADWNHLRRMLSHFLSSLLEDKGHPFRRDVLRRFPYAKEPPGRVPDLDPATFWQIVSRTPAHAQAAYVVLVATALRLGEYLRLTPAHLRPRTYSLQVPGTPRCRMIRSHAPEL